MKPLQESIFSRVKNKVSGSECTIWDFIKSQNISRSTDWEMLVISNWFEKCDKLIEDNIADIIGPIKDGITKCELLSSHDEIKERFENFVFDKLLNKHGQDIIKNNQKSVKFVIVMGQYKDPVPSMTFDDHFSFAKSGLGLFLEGGKVVVVKFKENI